jgi:hypothetical protein
VGQTAYPTPRLAAAFSQNATPPASAALVTVPATLVLHRHVYGSATVETASGDSVLVEVETGVATGVYDAVQYLAVGTTDETANLAFSFKVKPGFRYKFTLAGAAAFYAYNYEDV